MNPTLKKIGRWSGIIVVGIAILIVLFYAEENWRGARAWADTKKFWEAQGESFDFNRLIPPPVPDSENLATLPLFKLEPNPDRKGSLAPLALKRATRPELTFNDLPRMGSWQSGRLANREKMHQAIAACYAKIFGANGPAHTPLAQFDALFPFVGDLRSAAVTHPYWSFPQKYQPGVLDESYLPLITGVLPAIRIIVLHGVLALYENRPDLALSDFELNLRLASNLSRDPWVVSGLVALGINAINLEIVYEGLGLHAWNDSQLAQLQTELGRLDFLTDYRNAMHGECFGILIPTYDQLKNSRVKMKDYFDRARFMKKDVGWSDLVPNLWPDGWLDENKAQSVWFHLEAARTVDPSRHLVLGFKAKVMAEDIAHRESGSRATQPWNIFFLEAAPALINALKAFAYAQVTVDQASLACALERYRLAHGAYPATLDALVPSCAPGLPHDIMNGQPYHYRLQPDGTFLLYSVGWNQQDDGGKVIHEPDRSRSFDSKLGDWVWPSAPRT